MNLIDDTLFIIPARGGSKGLPGKNIKLLNGKPLIHYTIEAVQEVTDNRNICVSTDDEDILNVAKLTGIEIPFIRPSQLATDSASSIDVIIHALNFYKSLGRTIKKVMLLQPTSPLRTSEDIVAAYKLIVSKKVKAIVSVSPVDHNPLWINTLPDDLCMKDFLNTQTKGKRRQDLSEFYQLNGAIYLADVDYLIENRGFLGNYTYAYIMSKHRSVDIDDVMDFYYAETILRYNNNC